MLTSFFAKDFRAFAHLRIERLGLLNLVVGKNNVGKTTLLEALHLYGSGADPVILRQILEVREETEWVHAVFHRPTRSRRADTCLLGPADGLPADLLQLQLKPVRPSRVVGSPPWIYDDPADLQEAVPLRDLTPGLVITGGGEKRVLAPDDAADWALLEALRRPTVSLPAPGLTSGQIATLWDQLVLRAGEERVIDCLRLIAPVERITLVARPGGAGERIVMVRVPTYREPFPLRRLGDGMVRVFQIALALESGCAESGERPALLLLDEIENGIHYTVLPSLWAFLGTLALRYNVQIFATTHSWDCIDGFRVAAERHPQAHPTLIRLEMGGEPALTEAVIFAPEELPIVTREEIEVR